MSPNDWDKVIAWVCGVGLVVYLFVVVCTDTLY
jgi:hypothetical protein